jgi:hypothetical protein
MAQVYDDQDKVLLMSANTADYIGDTTRYAIMPIFPSGVLYRHLKLVPGEILFKGQMIATGIVTEMTQQEKDAVDAAELPGAKEANARVLELASQGYVGNHYDMGAQTSMNALLTEAIAYGLVNRAACIGTVLNWVKNVIGYYNDRRDAVMDAVTLAELEAVTWDFTIYDATDPKVTLKQVLAIPD